MGTLKTYYILSYEPQLYVNFMNVSSIHILSLSVRLYPINVKTTKIWRFGGHFCGAHGASAPPPSWDLTWPREGLWLIKISKISLQQNSIFIKIWKSTNFFFKSETFFVIVLQCLQSENVHNWNKSFYFQYSSMNIK